MDHVARIQEQNRRKSKARKLLLGNPLSRKIVAARSHGAVVNELSNGSTADQIGRLDELVGTHTVSERKMKEAIMRKAPGEMDKAIRKFREEGRTISVETLCAEAKSDIEFRKLCSKIGLELSWFETLASERMKVHGVV